MNYNKIADSIITMNSSSKGNFLDKVLYFIEYLLLIAVCFGFYSFLVFFITERIEGLGIILFIIYIFSVLCFDGIAAPLVHRDVKKLQIQGVNTGNTAFGWASIVFCFPFVGLAAYLAVRRADYKKQILTIKNQNNNLN